MTELRDKVSFGCGCANGGYGKVAMSLDVTAAFKIERFGRVIAILPISEFQLFRCSREIWRVAAV